MSSHTTSCEHGVDFAEYTSCSECDSKEILKLENQVEQLENIISEIHSWIVCAGITSPEDMAQNFERITEITSPEYLEKLYETA